MEKPMNPTDGWYTKSAGSWLQQILKERYGLSFSIQRSSFKRIRIGTSGAASFIELDFDNKYFSFANSDLPCCSWDATAEGWKPPMGKPLQAPGISVLPHPLIQRTEIGYHINYDILGLCYWMLSRQEEIGRTDLDQHERFPAKSSHAYKFGYLERPIVDEWLDILGQVIERLWPNTHLKQPKFQIKISHDVDIPTRYGFATPYRLIREMAGDLIYGKDARSFLTAPWIRLASRKKLLAIDSLNTFGWIMDLSERNDLSSAFYFFCGKTETSMDADYDIEHPAIIELMRLIRKRGHEIGLHPSYNTYQTPDAIVAEARRLQSICEREKIEQSEWGGRMHYLRWRHPITMYGWEKAGMNYDSTLCYADHAGFRCGTCFEYPAFDPVDHRSLKLRIRPLIAMENTVIAERYMGMGVSARACQKLKELKNACRAVNGCFTLLWHNSELQTAAQKQIYQTIITNYTKK
jgi:hypothetical protein